MINISFITNYIKKFTPKEKNLFYVSVVFVFLALLSRLVIFPAINKMSDLEKEIKETNLNIEKDFRFLSHKEKISKAAKKFESYSGEEGTPDDEFNSLMKLVDTFAKKNSIGILSRKPTGFTTEGFEKKYSIQIECQGTMPQLMDFFYSIESAPSLLMIESFVISPQSEESSVARCRNMIISKIVIP